MGDSLCKKPIFHSWLPLFAVLLAKGAALKSDKREFVGAVLEFTLLQNTHLSCEEIGKEVAKASFLILDSIQSKTRYAMKVDRERAAKLHYAIQKSGSFDMEEEAKLTASYDLLLRRARRNRKLLCKALEEIERFYIQNPYEELEEVLFFGLRSLAHIDIMISLHKEQMALYCTLRAV